MKDKFYTPWSGLRQWAEGKGANQMKAPMSDPGNLFKAGGGIFTGGWLTGLITGAGLDRFVHVFEGHIERGRLRLELPDGKTRTIESGAEGPDALMRIHRWRAFHRMVLGGSVGFAKSFVEGDWDSPNLPTLFEFGATNRDGIGNGLRGASWIRLINRARHEGRANSPGGSKQNIAFHYDLGNQFYKQWLDPSMTYSSAIFAEGDSSLEAAQIRKYRKLLDLLEVKPGEKILEIGCGWGGFAETAAKERGAKVTGITLSGEQLEFARQRMDRAQLAEQVDILLEDYRDVNEEFDYVVSIEMFEAVGEEYWPAYFEAIHRCLKRGGKAALQIITIDEDLFETYREDVDFIQAYIFPGGMLPSVSKLKERVISAGLSWNSFKTYGQHYARTLAAWHERFEDAWSRNAFPEEFDEIFGRIWRYYLSYCEGGFRGGSINVVQLSLAKS
jgi:cyclopropane-fatty-acyl-phospholipid synthase